MPQLKQPTAALSPNATIAQRLRAACPHLEPKWSARRRPRKGRGPRCEVQTAPPDVGLSSSDNCPLAHPSAA
ncbi:hypothetical protein CORC01_04317 [Colletotrichum orchidophilum]|uniref:Uncharacterized protein n=1 Tax=Colletotrichum orchidophilum TaxID=1209926 RepID=A0A1G4BG53_9PEZI|nr:uncharacterized protein CORC01_04317 [Colletotrichum orchidophilum]OHF00336.1 hypothetical protein CORC01_04317 [Colletotrichum orchidophilum]